MKKKISNKNIKILICVVIFAILLLILSIFLISQTTQKNKPEVKETEIKSICELATLKAYYHNVAKDTKEKTEGLLGLGEKEREFWIEYEGYATIGIDMEKVSMNIKEDKITITIPHAKVLDISVTTNNDEEEMQIIESGDGFFNKNKITTKDRQKAVKEAQRKMEQSVKNNKTLLQAAESRAKELIENYIKELGKVSGIDYKIEWKFIVDENQTK